MSRVQLDEIEAATLLLVEADHPSVSVVARVVWCSSPVGVVGGGDGGAAAPPCARPLRRLTRTDRPHRPLVAAAARPQ